MVGGVVPARQERSRRTVERLMRAAEALFAERGIADVGVAEIAARAGVGVGTFYGRFESRDAFVAAFHERFFSDPEPLLPERALPPARERTAASIVRALVRRRVRHYATRGPLLRAVLTHSRARPDAGFRDQAGRFAARASARLDELFAPHLEEIAHPEPTEAIRFAMWLVETALKDQLLLRDRHSAGLAFTDERLERELTRTALGYLGVEE